jgi:AcrR family transcriptional regulator
MEISPEDPRANQKERTRAALVEAATALLREGMPPTVPEAAERAKVSRATAYRYFPTQDALLVEVAAIRPSVEPVEQMLAELSTEDAETRLVKLLDMFVPILLEEEAHMRTALRVYLDTWIENQRHGDARPVREGRRMRWLDVVLDPARDQLSKRQYQRLRDALALTIGVESIIVMRDVCHVDDDTVVERLRWTAVALLGAALADPGPRRSR